MCNVHPLIFETLTFSYFSFVLASVVRERVSWAWIRAPSWRNCKALRKIIMVLHVCIYAKLCDVMAMDIQPKHNHLRTFFWIKYASNIVQGKMGSSSSERERRDEYELHEAFQQGPNKREATSTDLWQRMHRGARATRKDGGRRTRQGERLPVKGGFFPPPPVQNRCYTACVQRIILLRT